MALSQQKIREILLLLLYSYDFVQGDDEDAMALVMKELAVPKKYVLQAQEVRREIEAKLPLIDEKITRAATAYEFNRIPRIEQNILRLGVFELLYSPHIPGKVALAEAVRLTRKFASPEGATFVNAVLDAIYHSEGRDVAGALQQEQTS
ncbi:MAG: transcription antitermination factor NusB [Simkania sp.]|nr:transcription antitermination factor NusB [Simkania sp.]